MSSSCAAGAGSSLHGDTACAIQLQKRFRAEETVASSPAPVDPSICVGDVDRFAQLPNDLVTTVLEKVAASAGSPADLASAVMAHRRFRELAHSKTVLKNASAKCIDVRAKNWSDSANRFLQMCADSGNLDAKYLLGMILFYCIGNLQPGVDLIIAAAEGGHSEGLYALAIIMFNGSGGTKDDRNLLAGVGLCARSAKLGNVNALRELGACLVEGFGLRRSVILPPFRNE